MASDDVHIESRDRVTHGDYLATVDGKEGSGKLSWTQRGDARDAEHTHVASDLRGRGVAAKLVEALVEDAKTQGFKIIPTCSYVASQFDDHPEWADLRA